MTNKKIDYRRDKVARGTKMCWVDAIFFGLMLASLLWLMFGKK